MQDILPGLFVFLKDRPALDSYAPLLYDRVVENIAIERVAEQRSTLTAALA
jgi:hypothetical protein